MPETRRCPECGVTLPDDAAGGLCVMCGLRGALETPTATVPATEVMPAAETHGEKAGDRIGRYKLLQEIGVGGMGSVWMAEQEEPVRREVALKVIKLGMDTKSVIARFEAERQALALMDHPNIAKVLDAGATDTGRPYFVMELVRGIPITDYCDKHTLSSVERLELFIQVCHAVQHAHQKGIIHRDIKPSNVLVTSLDGVPVPKVIDFGIAKATTDQRLTNKTLFTAFEQFVGTPAYMSPEQAEMSALDVDTRSDIYSLGVLLYELLTGNTPFEAQRLIEAGLDEMRRIIREEEPLRPSTRISTLGAAEQSTVAKHRHSEGPKLVSVIRGDLDWIVMKALEKDRGRRYETANALAADLLRHLHNEPVTASPPSQIYRLQKLVRRNKLAFTAATVVAIVLVLGVIASTWQAIRATRAEREQTRLRELAKTEASRSQQVAQFLKDMLKNVNPHATAGRDATMLKDILDNTAKRIGEDLKDQPRVEAELRNTIGEVYEALGEYDKARTMHHQALATRKKLLGEEHVDVAESLDNLAFVLWREGEKVEAERVVREAIAIKRKLLGNEHVDLAKALNHFGQILRSQGKLAEAETAHREALAINRKLLGDDRPGVIGGATYLAWVLKDQGKLAEAERLVRNALPMQRKLLGDHPTVANSLGCLASIIQTGDGNLAEVESLQREVLTIWRRIATPEHPAVLNSLFSLATTLRKEGKHAEAEPLFRDSMILLQQTAARKPESHEYVERIGSLAKELAVYLAETGRYEEAVNLLRQALQIHQQAARSSPRNESIRELEAHTSISLARTLERAGQLDEAEAQFRQAINLYEQLLQDNVITDASGQEKLKAAIDTVRRELRDHAFLLAETGRLERAVVLLREILQSYKQAARDSPQNQSIRELEAHTSISLARTLERAGQLDEAEAQFRQAITLYEQLLQDNVISDAPDQEKLKGAIAYMKAEWASALIHQGKLPEVHTYIQDAAQLGDAANLNQVAWMLATSGDPRVRDGSAAIGYAERAVAATNRKKPMLLDTLAAAYAEAGQFERAVTVQQEVIALLKEKDESGKSYRFRLKLYESQFPYRDHAQQASLTRRLLDDEKYAEAESLARECLALLEKQMPGDWRTFHVRSMLGAGLLGQKRYVEAEPFLLAGYAGMKERDTQIPGFSRSYLRRALESLARLSEATGRPDHAAKWRKELADLDKAAAKQSASSQR